MPAISMTSAHDLASVLCKVVPDPGDEHPETVARHGGTLRATVTVTNTGRRTGAQVVQL